MLRASCLLLLGLHLAGQEPANLDWRPVTPLLQKYCYACHGEGEELEADLDLKTRPFLADRARTIAVLRELRSLVAQHEMPPEDAKAQPGLAERKALVHWVEARLVEFAQHGGLDPGRVTMRRLSRAEYANCVRDLFGITTDVTRGFPADDLGHGFDNLGAAGTFSVLHFEKYAAAAQRIAARALALAEPKTTRRHEAETLNVGKAASSVEGEWLCLCAPGPATFTFAVKQPGRYRLRVRAAGQLAGPEAPRLVVLVDGQVRLTEAIPEPRPTGRVVELELPLGDGRHELGFDFPNDWWKPEAPDPAQRDRNLLLDWFEWTGPLDAPVPAPGSAWLQALDPGRGTPAERARPILAELLLRAWRRPPQPAELTRLVALVSEQAAAGAEFAPSLAFGIEAALVSPNFLFRVEPGGLGQDQRPEPLDSWALATRLAFFLWSSTPDPALLARAGRDELRDPAQLRVETARLLADPRAQALARNFAAQWLELRELDQVAPDRKRFPSFTRDLRQDMREETEQLFLAVLREDRDVRELLDPEFTFLNERLAEHYGLQRVRGKELRRVQLEDRRLGGLLAQASILTLTSNPTRTSPVKRGKWILENLLDQAPPPPPPGNDSLKGEKQVKDSKTLREQMAIHRRDPQCATCHQRMDALGFTLETFDPIGRWRDQDGGEPIDATGSLPGGPLLTDVEDLKRVLAADPAFVRCLFEKLFVYAIGRGTASDDELLLDALAKDLPQAKPTLSAMITALVLSEPFRSRRRTGGT